MRPSPPPGPARLLRLTRSAVFAAVMVLLAVGAHVAAGGGTPGTAVPAAAVLVLTAAAHPVTRRERGLPALLAATAVAQLALHVTFALAMLPGCPASGSGPGTAGALAMPGMAPASPSTVDPGGGWSDLVPGSGRPAMVVAHVLAAVLAAWWLRRGERLAARLVALLSGLALPLRRVLTGTPPRAARTVSPPRPAVRAADRACPGAAVRAGGPVSRRGPPAHPLPRRARRPLSLAG